MKNFFLILFLATGLLSNAQSINYNTHKGFVAEGYDVVSYFSNEVKKGSKTYIATYDKVKFKFSSQENLDIFKANPIAYIPQYGGWCAYAIGQKSKTVSINPKTYEIRDGKLYLFYNSWGINTLKYWLEASPNALKIEADKNWKRIKNQD